MRWVFKSDAETLVQPFATFKYFIFGQIIMILMFGGSLFFGVGLAWAAPSVVVKILAAFWVLFMSAISCLVILHLVRGLSRHNWFVRVGGDRILINTRHFFNGEFPEEKPVVLELMLEDIEWARSVVQKFNYRHSQNRRLSSNGTHKFLDFKLKASQFDSLMDGLKDETHFIFHEAAKLGWATKYIPVQWIEESKILRLNFNGIKPNLNRSTEILRDFVRIETELQYKTDNESQPTDAIILEYLQQGDRMRAISLVQAQRGLTLEEAKDFVDELIA